MRIGCFAFLEVVHAFRQPALSNMHVICQILKMPFYKLLILLKMNGEAKNGKVLPLFRQYMSNLNSLDGKLCHLCFAESFWEFQFKNG